MKNYDVITFGGASRDVFVQSKHYRIVADRASASGKSFQIPLGTKIETDSVIFETGGGATNSAVTFARLGFRTAFVGKVGATDARGREILATLQHEGIDTRLVHHDGRNDTMYSIVLLSATGERTILIYRGASASLTAKDIDWDRLRARWFYVTTLSGNFDLLRRIVAFAKKRKIAVALNPGMAELKHRIALLSILKDVSVLILNLEEAALLSGIPVSEKDRIFKELCLRLPGLVVVTAGSKGAVVCDNARKYFSKPNDIAVRNTLGAGDAFGSGFIAGYLKSSDIAYALHVGTTNAESVIRHIGAKAGILRKFPSARSVSIRTVTFPN